jgi:hypothetical protein
MIPLDLLPERPDHSCPKNKIRKGYRYAGYAANKEDVQVTRVPLASLAHTPGVLLPPCEGAQ